MSLCPGLGTRDGEHGTPKKGRKFNLGVRGSGPHSQEFELPPKDKNHKRFPNEKGYMWSD